MNRKNIDQAGVEVAPGDTVIVKSIPDGLLYGLLNEDQEAIKACIGQLLKVADVNAAGDAEIEFTDQFDNFHTIWIATTNLEKKSDT
jgi:hypothetical protein